MWKNKRIKSLEYERYVAQQLALQGFTKIYLTPKSNDYGIDIICYDNCGRKCAIQCKHYSRPIGYRAVEEAYTGARYYNCQRALVIGSNCFTKNALKGATKIGVELFVCMFT